MLDARTHKSWKKDQHEWQMRLNDQTRISESHQTYKINKKIVLYGRKNKGAGKKGKKQ